MMKVLEQLYKKLESDKDSASISAKITCVNCALMLFEYNPNWKIEILNKEDEFDAAFDVFFDVRRCLEENSFDEQDLLLVNGIKNEDADADFWYYVNDEDNEKRNVGALVRVLEDVLKELKN